MQSTSVTTIFEKINSLYSPFRERIGNYGVIVTGIALVAVSFFIRTDIFEAILDFVGVLGMVAGGAVAVLGIFMLGIDKGWWDKIVGVSGEHVGGASPSPGDARITPSAVEERGLTPPVVVEPVPQPQPESPTMYVAAAPIDPIESMSPPHTSWSASFQQLPSSLVLLAMLPAALLILSVLPVTPWIGVEVGGWGRESVTESMSLWEAISELRELEEESDPWGSWNIQWEEGLVSYTLAIIGTIVNGVLFLRFMRSDNARRASPTVRSEAEARDSLELFLVSSILVCAFTSALLLHAFYVTSIAVGIRASSISLGGYLCILSLLSTIGYLTFLVAIGGARGCFNGMSLLTFVNFTGRTPRPHLALILSPLLVLIALGVLIAVYADDLVVTGILTDWASEVPSWGIWIFQLATTWVWLAVCIKRYHDLDKSAWWVLLIVISQTVAIITPTFVYLTPLYVLFVDYSILAVLMAAGLMAILMAVMWELLFVKGTPGDNRYGPQPWW